jgi:phosphatidylserine decarboxylase
MMTTEKNRLAREGRAVLAFLAVFILFTLVLGWWLTTTILGLFFVFSIYFFRNPLRVSPGDDRDVLSPADGKIVQNEIVDDERYLKIRCRKIGIFMSLFDVHVNRSPVSGTVEENIYNEGKFLSATLDKASSDNEQNALILKTGNGIKVCVVQIAGLIARRIVCYPAVGVYCERGSIFGMIKFGSRLDVYLPENVDVFVKLGQKVRAGETILARLTEKGEA